MKVVATTKPKEQPSSSVNVTVDQITAAILVLSMAAIIYYNLAPQSVTTGIARVAKDGRLKMAQGLSRIVKYLQENADDEVAVSSGDL